MGAATEAAVEQEPKVDDEMLGAVVISELCRSQARGDAGVKTRRGQFAALGRIIRAADDAEVERVFGVRK